MKRLPYVLLIALMVLSMLALAACGGDDEPEKPAEGAGSPPPTSQEATKAPPPPTERPDTPTPVPAEPTATAAPAATAVPTEPPPTPTPEPVEEDLSLSVLTEGLEGLRTYRSVFHMTFEGKDDDGQPVSGTWETLEEFTKDPQAQRISVTSSGFQGEEVGSTASFDFVTIGDTSYMVSEDGAGEGSCISMSANEEDLLDQSVFTPDMMGGVSGAKYVGTEVINGIRSKHYRWSERGVALFGFAAAEGDVWVAADGEFVVKYTTEATGEGTFLGESQEEGTVTVDYELIEVNGNIVIEAPADCESPVGDIPIMPDAQEQTSFSGFVTYSSPTALADVVAFYEEEMAKGGWVPGEQGMQVEGLVTLNYTKEGRSAQLMITGDNETQLTTVLITIEE